MHSIRLENKRSIFKETCNSISASKRPRISDKDNFVDLCESENHQPKRIVDNCSGQLNKIQEELDNIDDLNDADLLAFMDDSQLDGNVNEKTCWESVNEVDMLRSKLQSVMIENGERKLQLSGLSVPENSYVQAMLGDEWETSGAVYETNHIILDKQTKVGTTSEIQIGNGENLYVVNPDILVSATSLVGALSCTRQAVLKEKFPFPSVSIHAPSTNKAMVIGSAVHLLFQWAIRKKSAGVVLKFQDISNELKRVLNNPSTLQDIYSIGQTNIDEIVSEIESIYIPSILNFSTSSIGELTEVRDIEENMWSPRFGIKGKIDATISVRSSRGINQLIPLELKTGKPSRSNEHYGQAMLYSLLLADRYGPDVSPNFGILSYLKTSKKEESCIKVVRAKPAISGLLQTRNELASYLGKPWNKYEHLLPPTTTNERVCSWCPQQTNCALAYCADSDEVKSQQRLTSVVTQLAESFTPSEVEFWLNWVTILHAEFGPDQSVEKWLKKYWQKTTEEMELDGSTVGSLILEKTEKNKEEDDNFLLKFRRDSTLPKEILESETSQFSPLAKEDENYKPRILISASSISQRGKFVGLCFGTLKKIDAGIQKSWYYLECEKDIAKLFPEIKSHRLDIVYGNSSGFSYKMAVSNLSTLFVPEL